MSRTRKPAPPPPPRRTPPAPPVNPPGPARRHRRPGATAHVRRVTLNLLRHSACCPDDLRPTLDKLANGLDWNLDALTDIEKEALYATVDEDLANQAKDEFHADTESLVDHRFADEHCKLCGHQHIRFEFDLRNTAGGMDCKTGSTCIETYGLNVDGEGTAEEALQALRQAITKAKRKAAMEDWQKAWPNHAIELGALREDYELLRHNHQPWRLYRFLNRQWKRRCKAMVGRCRAIIKYYEREHFLTDTRTVQLWGKDGKSGTRVSAQAMVAELRGAEAKIAAIREGWERFIAANPRMDNWQRTRVDYWKGRAVDPNDRSKDRRGNPRGLSASDRNLLRNILRRNGNATRK